MGTIMVLSNPKSRIPNPEWNIETKLSDGTYVSCYPRFEIGMFSNSKYKVTLRDGATSEGLRFMILSRGTLLGKRYANLSTTWQRLIADGAGNYRIGTSIENLRVPADPAWHYSSNIYESDNVYNFGQN